MTYEVNAKHKLEGVEYVSSPNRSRRIKPSIIVLHDTAGRLDSAGSISWLCDRKAKASAHLVIGREGDVTQLVPFDVAAWHAGRSGYKGRSGVNGFSIGIELVNTGKLQSTKDETTARAWFNHSFEKAKYFIEYAGTDDHGIGWWMPYTLEQMDALHLVVDALIEHYNIKDITTHYAISPRRKVDVNPLFPITDFREFHGIKGEMGRA